MFSSAALMVLVLVAYGDHPGFAYSTTCVCGWCTAGNFITSTSWKSDTADSVMSVTSMATPHAAGAAALYLQVCCQHFLMPGKQCILYVIQYAMMGHAMFQSCSDHSLPGFTPRAHRKACLALGAWPPGCVC